MSDQCPRCLCERHIGPCAGLRLGAALLLALLACAPDDSTECVFDGRYEFGMLPSNGCGALSEQLYANNERDACYTTESVLALDGTRRNVSLYCEAGDPVVECSGFAHGSDGCRWDVYMRRIGP
jgi:hypothetical protein